MFTKERKKLHYGWIICFCCTLVSICTTGLTSNVFSAYMPHLQAAGFTAAQTSLTISVRCGFNFLGMLFVTRYYRLFSLRSGLALSCCLTALGALLYSFAANLFMLYLSAAVMGLGSALGSMVPLSILLKRWFMTHRAFAVGISASGTGIAAVIFPPLITRLVSVIGLAATFRAQCVFSLLCAGLMFALLRNKPEDMALHSYGEDEPEPPAAVAARPRPGLSRGQWIAVLAALLLFGGASCSAPSHISVVLMSGGTPEVTASLCVSLFGLSLTVSKWLYGYVVDKIGCYRSNLVFFGVLLAGFGCFCIAGGSTVLACVAVLLMGFGYPPATVGVSMWASDLSTDEEYARNFKRFQSAYIAGGMLLANLPGLLHDTLGSYVYAFMIFIVFMLFTLIVIQTVYKKHGAHI